jgi:hypothetical protein
VKEEKSRKMKGEGKRAPEIETIKAAAGEKKLLTRKVQAAKPIRTANLLSVSTRCAMNQQSARFRARERGFLRGMGGKTS